MESTPVDVWHPSTATLLPVSTTNNGTVPTEARDKPRAKKLKVAIACDICRAKKNKCDGVQPVCGRCLRRSRTSSSCTWIHGSARQNFKSSNDHILKLTKRIAELEKQADGSLEVGRDVQNIASSGSDHHSQSSLSNLRRPIDPEIDEGGDVLSAKHLGGSVDCITSQGVPLTLATDSPTSAMIGATADHGHALGFFGSSSAGDFISQVRRVVDRRMGSPRSEPTDGSHNSEHLKFANGNKGCMSARETIDYDLPSRRKADALMSVYWNAVHPLYPFLDTAAIKSHYGKLWTGQKVPLDTTVFLRIINTIFALSSQLNILVTPEERNSSSTTFLQRALGFLDLWTPGSLQTVQSLLLLGQYFQSTNEPHQCWMFVGHAVRTAQSLGLHLPETSNQLSSLEAQQLVRRVWHGCVLMDRFLAMTYGRPTMVGRSIAAAVPLPICTSKDVRGQSSAAESESDAPSEIAFFVQSLRLYEIMYEISIGLYDPGSKRSVNVENAYQGYFGLCSASKRSLSILDIDQRLMRWERELPTHLRLAPDQLHDPVSGKPAESEMVSVRQGVILRQRFLHVRLLSLRPILSMFIVSEANDSNSLSAFGSDLSERLANQCSIVCVKVAQEAIELVHSNRPTSWSTTGLLAAWWYNVLFLYTAATVLVAAKLKDSIISELGEESISRSWQMAIGQLESYASFSGSIPKLIATLNMLFDEVPQRYSHHRQQVSHEQQGISSAPPPRTSGKVTDVGHQVQTSTWNFGGPSDTWQEGALRFQLGNLSEEISMNLDRPQPDFGLDFDPGDLSWLDALPL